MAPRPDALALVGKVVGGRYRIVQLLASGGTGHIYVGEVGVGDERRRVALKILREIHRGAPDLVRRFEREAIAAGKVRHPNVLEVLEGPFPLGAGASEGGLCFAMELLVGLDLADTLAYDRTIGAVRAVRIARGVAEGLGAAHAAGVIHRDVKPENIFLVHAADGREAVKLLDFGFAWMPGDEVPAELPVVGTPEYLAPEQAQGAPASPAADVYSLGIVLYEMLAGRVPFIGEYPAIAHLHALEPLPPIRGLNPAAALSLELEAVVHRALAKDPAGRYSSMAELRRALLSTPEAGVPFRAGEAPSSRRSVP